MPALENLQVSIIIPAYNEEQSIEMVLKQLMHIMRPLNLSNFEIIVVDDGSKDQTGQQVQQFADVKLVTHHTNRGYGAALKTGIMNAQYETICITDADGTYPNERIPDLLWSLAKGDYDMAVGARIGDNVAIPLIRRPPKWVINRLAEYVVGEKIPDLNSGLRIFSRKIAKRYFNLLPDGFSFTSTITLAMLTHGYSVGYIPIDYYHRIGQSKIQPIRSTLLFIRLVLMIGLYFAPLKIFVPISLLFIIGSVSWGIFSTIALGKLADVSTLMIMLTGVQIGIMGLLAELINHRLDRYENDR
jgi:glycosyltransferase involved in cell wall biosynthesis